MIVVELKEAPEGPGDYQVVARLTVNDDGTYQFDDPDEKFLADVSVLVLDESVEGGPRRVSLEDNPATWARNLDSIFHSGIWVADRVIDTGVPEG